MKVLGAPHVTLKSQCSVVKYLRKYYCEGSEDDEGCQLLDQKAVKVMGASH